MGWTAPSNNASERVVLYKVYLSESTDGGGRLQVVSEIAVSTNELMVNDNDSFPDLDLDYDDIGGLLSWTEPKDASLGRTT